MNNKKIKRIIFTILQRILGYIMLVPVTKLILTESPENIIGLFATIPIGLFMLLLKECMFIKK